MNPCLVPTPIWADPPVLFLSAHPDKAPNPFPARRNRPVSPILRGIGSQDSRIMKTISRRRFIGKSSLAVGLTPLALGSLAAPMVRSARAGEPGANEKIRLGLIGCGGMGQGDLQCFFLNPEVDCAVVCDVDDAQIAKGVAICERTPRQQTRHGQRLPPRAGPQGHRRGPDRHARPLARLAHRHGLPGRQGRLRRETPGQDH